MKKDLGSPRRVNVFRKDLDAFKVGVYYKKTGWIHFADDKWIHRSEFDTLKEV